jgi:hypothetical protein
MRLVSLAWALLVLPACSSDVVPVGDICDGSIPCTGGSLCAEDRDGMDHCLPVCTDQKDCPANTTCTGTSGPSKVCQTEGTR